MSEFNRVRVMSATGLSSDSARPAAGGPSQEADSEPATVGSDIDRLTVTAPGPAGQAALVGS